MLIQNLIPVHVSEENLTQYHLGRAWANAKGCVVCNSLMDNGIIIETNIGILSPEADTIFSPDGAILCALENAAAVLS